MQLKTKISSGVLALSVALTAQAGELVEQRGHKNCVKRIEHELTN